jgi:8-hydroxy-5-deazaflavin:NADPH oxidoreductase
MKKIGIIGSGSVAVSLANGFLKYGHQVMMGTRDLSKVKDWETTAGDNGFAGTFNDAAEFGDIVVLAIKGSHAKEVIQSIEEKSLNGKTIIDPTNPIDDQTPPNNGVLRFSSSFDKSLMEELQSELPSANFVKAFSCIGSHLMVNPDFAGQKPTMFICGNNESAKKEVTGILDLFGFETSDMGGAPAARAIEPLCILWCIPGFAKNEWGHAFKLLKP